MKIDVRPLMIVVLLCMTTFADEPPTKLRKLIDDSIQWYELFPSEESTEPMKPMVALRWPNNVRGAPDGATVFWTTGGRPEAVAAIFAKGEQFILGFDSLSRGTIVANRDGEVVWNPQTPGVQFRSMDGAPAPTARLRQMKALAKQFAVTFLGWKRDNSQREELRLMTTPLFRYKIDKPDTVQDGVIFAYATGTDPEALLVIEAFGEAGRFQWQYAFVRRTSGGLQGRFRDRVVWEADRFPPKTNPLLNSIEFSHSLEQALELLEDKAQETVESEATR